MQLSIFSKTDYPILHLNICPYQLAAPVLTATLTDSNSRRESVPQHEGNMKANNQHAPKLLIGSDLKRFVQGERFHELASPKSIAAHPPQERSVWRNSVHCAWQSPEDAPSGSPKRAGPPSNNPSFRTLHRVNQASGCPEGWGPWGPPYREGLGG